MGKERGIVVKCHEECDDEGKCPHPDHLVKRSQIRADEEESRGFEEDQGEPRFEYEAEARREAALRRSEEALTQWLDEQDAKEAAERQRRYAVSTGESQARVERALQDWAKAGVEVYIDRFDEILSQMSALHSKKGRDYGSGTDPYANVRASQDFGVAPWIGALIRLNDKITRLKSFIRNGSLANESIEDSIRDIQVYSVIMQILYEEGGSH